MEPTKKVPVLRFPEFEGEWENKEFGEIFSFRTTNSFSRENLNYDNGSVKNIHYGDIHTKFSTLFDVNKEIVPFISSEIELGRISEDNYCKIGDLIFADASEDYEDVGKCIEIINLNNEKVLSGLHTILARPGLYKIFIGFSGYLMKSNRVRLQIKVIAQGSKVLSISSKRLSELNLNLPTLPEQQKIADFLTKVDKKIEQLTKKKQLLESYKKGVMQKIFSQEIRFKDDGGNDYPEWEVKKFSEIFSFRTTNSFSRDNLNYDNGYIKNIHYGDIHTKFSTLFDANKEVAPFVNFEIELGRISEENYCKVGDLIFADASEDYEDVGKCIEIINLNNEKVLSGLHTILARPDLYKMCVGFNGYLMKSTYIRLQIKIIAQGSKVLSISSKRLSELGLLIPYISEQTKIANFLTSIDNKINQVSKQLEGMKTYKKGLLQKMFV